MPRGPIKRAGRKWIGSGLLLIMFLVVLGMQAMSFAHAGQPAGSTSTQSMLRAEGRWIFDESGNVVILHGANFFGYEYGLWSSHAEADYRRMASWGFNVVRLPIAWSFIEPRAMKYDASYFTKYVDRDIAWAKKYGLYIVLDMHQYAWSPRFTYIHRAAGIPAWAQTRYPNTGEGEARAKADFWNNLGPNGTPPSASNPSMQDRLILAWMYVAKRYAGEKTIAGYDLFNEPDTTRCSCTKVCYLDESRFVDMVATFQARLVDRIRKVDGKHMILWEPGTWEFGQHTSYLTRANVVYSPHYPGWGKGNSIYAYADKSWLEASVNAIVGLSERWNQPVFMGEWGICVEAANATQYIRDLTDLQDRYLISWTWWSYGREDGFGMLLLDQNGVERTALTSMLVRPYVRVSSTLILSSNLSADGREFRIAVNGPATVSIYLPGSYVLSGVHVDQGSALWDFSGAPVLIASAPAEATQLVVAFQ